MSKPPIDPYPAKSGNRPNLFLIAYRNFPGSLFATIIGIALWGSPFLYGYFHENGENSILISFLLMGIVMTAVPLVIVYLVSLIRARKIRIEMETEVELQLAAISVDLKALQAKEIKEEIEVMRLEQVVEGEIQARKVKDEKEDERWDLLTESLREQKEIVELATEERLLVAQQVKDIKEEGEVIRKGLVSDDLEARHIKDLKEDKRWALLNEQLRKQEETGQLKIEEKEEREIARQALASEERILAAQQVKDTKDEREIMRVELALGDLKAREVKEQKEDDRWDLLNESLRLQNETVELASEERIIVAQQVKDLKEEGEIMRKGLASDDLEARHIKESKDEKRWAALHERLRIQEERSEERDRQQLLRDKEYVRMRNEDEIKEQYKVLFSRYIRNSQHAASREVADGLAPIPEAWLKLQPEILKNPALMVSIQQYNER